MLIFLGSGRIRYENETITTFYYFYRYIYSRPKLDLEITVLFGIVASMGLCREKTLKEWFYRAKTTGVARMGIVEATLQVICFQRVLKQSEGYANGQRVFQLRKRRLSSI